MFFLHFTVVRLDEEGTATTSCLQIVAAEKTIIEDEEMFM
jgi:hypothetical protein